VDPKEETASIVESSFQGQIPKATTHCCWLALDVRGGEVLLNQVNIKQSVVINLAAEDIFAYMSDLGNQVDWSSAVIMVRNISPGAPHVGTRVRSTIRFLGRWLDMTFEVVECEPGRSLTIKSIAGISPCLFCYQFEPVEDGGTTVSQEAVIHLTGILGLEEPVVIRVISRQMEHDLLTLKDLLEASAAISGNAG
jgi:polyketide cyclase/dehydrase/lipid transport protein